jgi:hypothetical protein
MPYGPGSASGLDYRSTEVLLNLHFLSSLFGVVSCQEYHGERTVPPDETGFYDCNRPYALRTRQLQKRKGMTSAMVYRIEIE